MLGMGSLESMILLIIGSAFLFWIWMLIEAATREAEASQDRLIWVLIIVFTHVIGAAIYFVVRRPVRRLTLGR